MEASFSENLFGYQEEQYMPSDEWYPQTYYESDPLHVPFYTSNPQTGQLTDVQFSKENQDSMSNHSWSNPPQQSNHNPQSTTTINNCLGSTEGNDPFSLHCRIPVPDMDPLTSYHWWMETSFMYKRNERERQRVRSVNDGFSKLRNHLPRNTSLRRRQSKVDTLRHAISYIKQLQTLLDNKEDDIKS